MSEERLNRSWNKQKSFYGFFKNSYVCFVPKPNHSVHDSMTASSKLSGRRKRHLIFDSHAGGVI